VTDASSSGGGTVTDILSPSAPPSVPGNVSAEVLDSGIIRIRWTISTGGNRGIRYNVYRDGKHLATVFETNYDDRSPEVGRWYEYVVEAVDGLKNVSSRSKNVVASVPNPVTPVLSEDIPPVVSTVGTVPAPEKVYLDSDGDGLSDAEEERLGTDPEVADSDGDGFSDGDEVAGGFNPLQYSPGDKSDKVAFESLKGGSRQSEREDPRYAVTDVRRRESGSDGAFVTEIIGTGPSNVYLVLYVFSDPIVVVVRTDMNGNWRYELDRDLEDGDHEVYVAVTDNLGRITAQSKPLPFTKTAEAVTVRKESFPAQVAEEGNRSPLSRTIGRFASILVTVAILSVAVVIFFVARRESDRPDRSV